VRFVDAFAKYQDDDNSQAEEVLLASANFKRMRDADSRVHWNYGQSEGGWLQRGVVPQVFFDSNTVAGPS
jgi:hypothetical protein